MSIKNVLEQALDALKTNSPQAKAEAIVVIDSFLQDSNFDTPLSVNAINLVIEQTFGTNISPDTKVAAERLARNIEVLHGIVL